MGCGLSKSRTAETDRLADLRRWLDARSPVKPLSFAIGEGLAVLAVFDAAVEQLQRLFPEVNGA